jgi:hypothetical protein
MNQEIIRSGQDSEVSIVEANVRVACRNFDFLWLCGMSIGAKVTAYTHSILSSHFVGGGFA